MAGDCGLLRSHDCKTLPHYKEALGGSVPVSPFVVSYAGLAGVPQGSLVVNTPQDRMSQWVEYWSQVLQMVTGRSKFIALYMVANTLIQRSFMLLSLPWWLRLQPSSREAF